MKRKALLLENIHQDAVEYFKKNGFEVELVKGALSQEELVRKIKNVDVLGIRSKTTITEEVIREAKKLKVIGCYIIGLNKVDLEACQRAGINVFNAPYSSTRSVAELTMGMIISLLRKISDRSQKAHQGIWEKKADGCFEMRGKTLGIIGYGNIGSQVSVLGEALGMKVIFYDLKEKMPLGNARKMDSVEEVLKKADVVTVHVSENVKSINLLDRKRIRAMKKGSYLLNLSRGTVVDIPALYESLVAKKISGAAIDVHPKEPASNDEKFLSQLQGLPNVILSPHVGASTEEAQKDIAQTTSEKICRYFQEGSTIGSVNFPEVTLTRNNGDFRLIHIHQNVPGVLSSLNNLIAKEKINITGQHLQTMGEVGYAVIDTNKKLSSSVIDKIERLEATIKVIV